ncbi:MAG TPA: GNAT family N-acetyltransferase [Caulobacteraceae bacterium]
MRLATPEDLGSLRAIEESATSVFAGTGLLDKLGSKSSPAEAWAPAQRAGTLWVADDGCEGLAGFLAATIVGEVLHIEEMDVIPDRQGGGLGRRLMQTAITWAVQRRLAAVTLTTFRQVAWNAPFYVSLGFREVGAHQSPRLCAILAGESGRGLDPRYRCAMMLSLAGA